MVPMTKVLRAAVNGKSWPELASRLKAFAIVRVVAIAGYAQCKPKSHFGLRTLLNRLTSRRDLRTPDISLTNIRA